jgi:hypothetical protein
MHFLRLFRSSTGPTVASIRSWFKLREISIKGGCAAEAGGEQENRAYNFEDIPTTANVPTAPPYLVLDVS